MRRSQDLRYLGGRTSALQTERSRLATPRLPTEVTQQGVVVAKANAGFLKVVALRSDDESMDRDALSDIIASRVLDQIARVPGVGSTQLFGSEYAMNIWLNPDRLRGFVKTIQSYNQEIGDAMEGRRGVYEQAAAMGYDRKTIRNLVRRAARLRKRVSG